jgi:hypothetical protein
LYSTTFYCFIWEITSTVQLFIFTFEKLVLQYNFLLLLLRNY